MINALYEKMVEYLNMEDEIDFKEFDGYYKQTLRELEANYEKYDQQQGLHALFVMDNLKANSESRTQRKFPEAKKYKKISQRTHIWVEALFAQLVKLGMNEQQIQEQMEKMYEDA
ncbi:hypothetical protein BEP19_01580 [Ammoniphilus oxalaticus]|uniref:Uncharacterized protein n=1 Tax=Ammoniphilus oxalaticus TaxID=66863 RepID=A0A419SN71_9BACL|nr:hypothetical protein [Ammoniphilus oxalaticus]RKD25659.1 hypothetical protein BEP19_01580 [Ammoniphilus oxalaticus]